MLVTHCLPCTEKQARQSSLFKLDLDGIPNSSICRMAGNAMNVACIGSVLFCCALSFDRISWENSKLNNRSIHRVKIWFNCPLQPVAATMMLICNSCMQRYCPAIKKARNTFLQCVCNSIVIRLRILVQNAEEKQNAVLRTEFWSQGRTGTGCTGWSDHPLENKAMVRLGAGSCWEPLIQTLLVSMGMRVFNKNPKLNHLNLESLIYLQFWGRCRLKECTLPS